MKYYEVKMRKDDSGFLAVKKYKSKELAIEDILKTVRERVKYLYGKYPKDWIKIGRLGESRTLWEFSTLEELEESYRNNFEERQIRFYGDSWLYGRYVKEEYYIVIREMKFEDD